MADQGHGQQVEYILHMYVRNHRTQTILAHMSSNTFYNLECLPLTPKPI